MFIILLFIFLLILIIVNIILISKDNKDKKKLVFGDGNKSIIGDNKSIIVGNKSIIVGNNKSIIVGNKQKLVHGGSKKSSNHPSGWQLYTLENCEHCDKQMEKLGGFKTYVKYKQDGSGILVNNIDGPLYSEPIDGFPFWYNSATGEERYGGQEIDTLLSI
jgi:hypothetical protein